MDTTINGIRNPLVTLIVPCYNVADYCDDFFKSVMEQTYKNLQIVVVNDGSTDATEKKLFKWKERIESEGFRFEYVRQANAGLGGAINTGLKHVEGQYLCWADPDDCFHPNSFEARLRCFDANPGVGVVTSDAKVVDFETKETRGLVSKGFPLSWEPNQFELMLRAESIFCSGCHMVSVRAFRDVNPKMDIYPERRGQNWQLLLPVYYRYPRVFLPEPLYNYSIREGSMSCDAGYEEAIKRNEEHLTIKRETLARINMSDQERRKYLRLSEEVEARANARVAARYKKRSDLRRYCRRISETGKLTLADRIRYGKLLLGL